MDKDIAIETLIIESNREEHIAKHAITMEVRELYRMRWEIEIFFKFIKQNLKLKRFFGTSENAVKIQIYTALIAYLLAYLLKPKYLRMTDFLRKMRYAMFLDYRQLSFF